MDRFRYQPLDDARKEIRLLHILPGTDDLQCRLEHVLLPSDGRPRYEAISYVWSLVPGVTEVTVAGKQFTFPAAAAQVLRYLRNEKMERTVWIDSICIDQQNTQEKNHQVAIMGDIYRKAAQTLVWLGESDMQHTEAAFKSLDLVHDQLCAETNDGHRLRDVLYGTKQIFQYSTTKLPDGCDFDALRSLFRRPWFGRRWVVQEAALASQGMVYCGPFVVSMLKLFRCAVWIQHKQHQLPFDLDKGGGMLNASYMSAYVDHDQGWFSEKHGQRAFLADMFRYFRTFDVTNESDRVFSLLGLTGWHFKEKPFPDLVTPDYDKPVNEVLRDATKTAILESGDLWVFRYIDHLDQLDMATSVVPSWVPALFRLPDFTKEPNPLRSAFKANRDIEHLLEKSGMPALNVHCETHDDNAIMVQGLIIADVDLVGQPLGTELEDKKSIAKLVGQIIYERSLAGHSDLPTILTVYDLGLVLVGGSTFDPEPMPGAGGAAENTLRTFTEAAMYNPDVAVQTEVFSRYVWAIRFACMNRRLFRTTDGRLGIGPKAMQEGDLLVVLAASRMPMIFRALEDGKYAVLGPCYAHGVMQGEAAVGAMERGLELESFQLR